MATVPQPLPGVDRLRKRRRWPRALGIVCVALALAYVTLPVWLPAGWLARQLEWQLSGELQRPVSIGRLSVGWMQGVVIENLAIGELPDAPNEYLAKVGRLRCDFTPLATLVTGRVNQLSIRQPELWLVRDADGRLNIDRLPSRQHSQLPSHRFTADEVTCHIWAPKSHQDFRIETARCRLEPQRALLDVSGSTVMAAEDEALSSPEPACTRGGQDPRRLSFDARITVPKLRPDLDLSLSGIVRVEWTNLALTDLPLSLVPALPVEQVGGRTSGTLSFETHSDLTLDFDQQITLHGVRLMWAGLARPAIVPDASLRCSGRWDPQIDRLRLRGLDYETQAVHLYTSDRRGLEIDPRGRTSLDAALMGEVKDWELLRREVPQIDQLADSLGLDLAGRAAFSLEARRRGDEGRIRLILEARQSRCTVTHGPDRVFEAADGVDKRLELAASGDFTARTVRPSVHLVVGELLATANVEGRLPKVSATPPLVAPGNELAPSKQDVGLLEMARLTDWDLKAGLELETPHVEQVLSLFPPVENVAEFSAWRGPVQVKLTASPGKGGSRVDAELKTDAATSLAWGEWFEKLPGEPLTLTAGLTVPHGHEGQIDDLAFRLSCGSGAIGVDPGAARIQYRLDNADDLDADVTLGVTVGRVETLAGLCPRWIKLADAGEQRSISGSLRSMLQAKVSRKPGDVRTRFMANVDANGLAARWGGELNKPAGEPLSVWASGDTSLTGSQRRDYLVATVDQPAAQVEAVITRGGRPGATEGDKEEYSLVARVHDIQRWLQTAPALAERLREFQPAGSAVAKLTAKRAGDHLAVEMSVDAGQVGFVLPGDKPGEKAAGVPAEMAVRFESGPEGACGAGDWKLTNGHARLAGLIATEISGELTTAKGAACHELAPAPFAGILGGLPGIDSVHLRCLGTAKCEQDLERLSPGLARLRERLGLSGGVKWETEVSGNEEAIHFSGRFDARELAWSVPTGQPVAPTIHKPAGTPASLTVDLAAVPGPDESTRRLDARVDLDLDGNHLKADGYARVDGWSEGTPRVGDADLLASLSLDAPGRILAWAPGMPVSIENGTGAVELEVERRDGMNRLSGGHVRLHEMGITSGKSTLHLDGDASWDDADIRLGGLAWRWGGSGGRIDGQVSLSPQGMNGQVNLGTDRLDFEELLRQAGDFTRPLQPAPATAPADEDLSIRRVLAYLGGSNLQVDGRIGTLQSIMPPGIKVESGDVGYRLKAERGPLVFTFTGTADGGAVEGRVETRADAAEPTMRLTYTADHIRPGPLVDIYLRRTFPGMTATGPVTLIDESNQKLFPAPGELNGPTGKGELIIDGGSVVGRAAPKVVTRFFPGLNLARFDFSYMHSWFTKDITGRIHHQMIYKGRYYNIYMNGYSEPTGFRYEVGVDFLADFNSKFWAESGQGRVPMFTKTGRIRPDGSIEDETVTYRPERFFDTVLVRNNPVFTAYLAVKKRVRAEK